MVLLNKIKNNKKLLLIISFIIILVVIDQISKILLIDIQKDIISNLIKIDTVKNYSGAFGVGQKGTTTFIITNIIVIGILIRFMHMQKEQIDKKTYVALSLVIAGAIGNLIDKIFRGYVLQFIVIKELAFNIADLFIILGWVLLALFFAIYTYKFKDKKEDSKIEEI